MNKTSLTKKLLVPVAIIAGILFGNAASAQDYYNRKSSSFIGSDNIRLGLTLNPNIGWYRFSDDDYDSSGKLGFSYGLIADIGFSDNYYFSTGLLINSISGKVTPPSSASDSAPRDWVRLQYADIPLTIKLKSVENEMGRFYGQFGFTAGLKVSGKEKLSGASKSTSVEGDQLFRLGLQIGGGAEWTLNDNISLLTGLSFNNGFTKAINKHGDPKSSYFGLNVGILF